MSHEDGVLGSRSLEVFEHIRRSRTAAPYSSWTLRRTIGRQIVRRTESDARGAKTHCVFKLLQEDRRTAPFSLACCLPGVGDLTNVPLEPPLTSAALASLWKVNLPPQAQQVNGQPQLPFNMPWSKPNLPRSTFNRVSRAVVTLSRPTSPLTITGRPTVFFNYSTGTRRTCGLRISFLLGQQKLRLGR